MGVRDRFSRFRYKLLAEYGPYNEISPSYRYHHRWNCNRVSVQHPGQSTQKLWSPLPLFTSTPKNDYDNLVTRIFYTPKKVWARRTVVLVRLSVRKKHIEPPLFRRLYKMSHYILWRTLFTMLAKPRIASTNVCWQLIFFMRTICTLYCFKQSQCMTIKTQ